MNGRSVGLARRLQVAVVVPIVLGGLGLQAARALADGGAVGLAVTAANGLAAAIWLPALVRYRAERLPRAMQLVSFGWVLLPIVVLGATLDAVTLGVSLGAVWNVAVLADARAAAA